MRQYKITDLPISTGQPPEPNETVAIWDGREMRRWVNVGEWERIIKTQERQRCRQAVEKETSCCGSCGDVGKRVIDAIDALGEK